MVGLFVIPFDVCIVAAHHVLGEGVAGIGLLLDILEAEGVQLLHAGIGGEDGTD